MKNDDQQHNNLARNVATLPRDPGVYLFRDAQGRVLYIGKANNIRARVRSYLSHTGLSPAKQDMIRRAADADAIVARNEQEALTLEASLIRRHKPPYNIRLVDDSSYLYIKITNDAYPRIQTVRTVEPDGAWYRGPFPSSGAVRSTLKTARKFFPWCSFRDPSKSKGRACFAYHIKLCPGVCTGKMDQETYRTHIKRLARFLDGHVSEVIAVLEKEMGKLSSAQKYEQAAAVRDRIRAIRRTMDPQHAVTTRNESAYAIGLARHGAHGSVAVVRVREGRIIGRDIFHIMAPAAEQDEAVIREFLIRYRRVLRDENTVPFLIPVAMRSTETLPVVRPRRGWKKHLLAIAEVNAKPALSRFLVDLDTPANNRAAIQELGRVLGMKRLPHRIEAYDISNIQGALATASLVSFHDGMPKRDKYRKFRITTGNSPDDTGMMREVLTRRLDKIKTWPPPDLIIVDGGKGQLGAGLQAIRQTNIELPIAALAKRKEEIFLPGKKYPIQLPLSSPALRLIQRIRDEAHRFALAHHRTLRKKRMTRSALEDIPGIGPVSRKRLLRAFGSLATIRIASEEDIAKVVGKIKARNIRKELKI